MPRKLDTPTFISKATQTHNGKYTYENTRYITTHAKVVVTCPTHGDFAITPSAHVHQRQGCMKCANAQKSTDMLSNTERFIVAARKIHGDTYNYHLVSYTRASTPVEIECTTHGVFKQTPSNHLHSTAGCPTCGKLIGAYKRTTPRNEFIAAAVLVHGDRYDYSLLPERVHTKVSVTITCKIHGNFTRVPDEHIRYYKIGCPLCGRAESKGETWVANKLDAMGIPYIRQHTFGGCVGNARPLKFDFYVPSINTAIEYDGDQHFRFIPWMHKTHEAYELYKRHDEAKQLYCSNADIKLIRISDKSETRVSQILEDELSIL